MTKLRRMRILRGKVKPLTVALAALSTVCLASPVFAKPLAEVLELPDNLWIGGRLKQGTGTYYDRYTDGLGWGPSQFIAELQAEWTPTRNVTVISDFWLRGDWFYQLDADSTGPGLQDFTSPGSQFVDQFDFFLSENRTSTLPEPFGSSGRSNMLLDDFEEDVIRELSIRVTDPGGKAALKIGKFQRGWGQADGLRLLDILNPQDLRQRSVFTDTEELRIPQWGAALTLNMDPLGLSAPFEFIGMKNTSFEVVFSPVVRHSEFVVNNPTPSRSASGGPMGLPFPRLIEAQSGWGMPFLGARLSEVETDNWDDFEVGGRFKFDVLGGQATLNGFYGFQDLPIIETTGATLHIGTFLNDPSAPGVVNVPLDLPTTIGAMHGPGGYVDFLQSVAAGAPIGFPLVPFGCVDPIVGGAGVPCSVTADFNLDYTYRQKTVGFSFTRDMTELKFGRKGVSPVLRMEAAYEIDKPFNKGTIDDPFIPGDTAAGSPALITTPEDSVAYRDQVSVLLGFDFNLWVPGWQSQRSSIFMTTQFFEIFTENPEGLLFQAPYAVTNVEKYQEYLTQTYTVGLFNDKVILDGLAIWDIDKGGVGYRQRIDFSLLGNEIKPRIEVGHFSGGTEQGLLGLYRKADYVEFSITHQF